MLTPIPSDHRFEYSIPLVKALLVWNIVIKYVVQPVNTITVTTLLLQFNNKTSLLKTRETGDLRFVIFFLAFMNIPYGIW